MELLRFHDLRHTFASRLSILGVPINLLGHSNIMMTIRYAHHSNQGNKDAVKLLERLKAPTSAPELPPATSIPTDPIIEERFGSKNF